MSSKYSKKILLTTIFLVLLSNDVFAKQFISIKNVTNVANLRAGPGVWYPIKWILKSPDLPLRLIEEEKKFSKVELHDGTIGWLSKTLISKKVNLIVLKDTNLSNKNGLVLAKVLKDFIIKTHDCNIKNVELCKVKVAKKFGYIEKKYLWGYN